MSVKPEKVVASFDSASVLHAATVAAIKHEDFPHLGNSAVKGAAARIAGRLPWPILKPLYSRIGGAEGIDPSRLSEIDMDDVAKSFATAYPQTRYPAVIVGSSNGAMTHLAAAIGAPWLPGTVLVPVHHVGDPHEPDAALSFGRTVGPRLLDANPGITLHQMHDSAQDELMTARMAYFRTKWSGLPTAYAEFLTSRLDTAAPVILVNDESTWPVVRVSERHVFQSGGRGGLTPQDYQEMPHTPEADDRAPEAEWGCDPKFADAIRGWCLANNHPLIEIRIDGPQEAAHPVAEILRDWTRSRGGAADRLLVPSFVLGDPWRTITIGAIPFWTFFPVQSALQSLQHHLASSSPYREVNVLVMQHGANSPGMASPNDFEDVIDESGATARLLALRENQSPHDIGSLGRYGPVLAREPDAELPWIPLSVDVALESLSRTISQRDRSIVVPRKPAAIHN